MTRQRFIGQGAGGCVPVGHWFYGEDKRFPAELGEVFDELGNPQ